MSIRVMTQPLIQFELKLSSSPEGIVYVLGSTSKSKLLKETKEIIETHAHDFQAKKLLATDKRSLHFVGKSGPVWILKNTESKRGQHYGLMDESVYGWFRDQAGSVIGMTKNLHIENLQIYLSQCSAEITRAVLIGSELATYQFFNVYADKKVNYPKVFIESDGSKITKSMVTAAQQEAVAIQLARHLVNLPPNEINPTTLSRIASQDIQFPNTKVTVWDEKKLATERMNLLLAVGAGSKTPPKMIHLRYRPKKASRKKPIAFVGKGITFDTGGLDIKPSSGMRMMKKDMGGSAAVLALAYWVAHSNYSRPCDFYLALAENSVDSKSMRPSDLYKSRAGFVVEIDNTDAEGRLVLADVMDVAVTQKLKDEPEILVDIATLTGAIKVALGADVAGLFCNNDVLSEQICNAGQVAGEPAWRMPLISKMFSGLNSNFADFRNSADGFGGAVTAALFLEKFAGGKKWAHLDVYCWNDKPTGALAQTGANGQPVQMMIEWLKRVSV